MPASANTKAGSLYLKSPAGQPMAPKPASAVAVQKAIGVDRRHPSQVRIQNA